MALGDVALLRGERRWWAPPCLRSFERCPSVSSHRYRRSRVGVVKRSTVLRSLSCALPWCEW